MTPGTPNPTARKRQLLRVTTACWWFVLLGLCWSGGILPGWSAEPVTKEYHLKAAFLYNFTKFVEWPTNRLTVPDEPLIIGVLGNNPFGEELARAVQGRTQNGHALVVTNLTEARAGTNVHLLFVPRGQEALFEPQCAALHAAGVLTVGETETFAKLTGLITFTTEADKIRFEINLGVAETSGLRISSKLLQLAKVVRPKP